ncbi:MAG: hypothetical protein WBG62_20420 [Cyclobacteriaceae bacterium]
MNSLADKYYITAADVYPFDVEVTLENLEYALSYDAGHNAANTLMGVLRMESFHDYAGAEEYFCAAMASDPESVNTCVQYLKLLLKLRKITEAERLLNYLKKLPGAMPDRNLAFRAQMYELKKDFGKARFYLNEAMLECVDNEFMDFLKEESSRIDGKIQMVSVSGSVIT